MLNGESILFTRRRFQGAFTGTILASKRLRSGALTFRVLCTHWGNTRMRGNTAVWIGERAILQVLSTMKGST